MGLPRFDPPADLELGASFWEGVAEREIRMPRCFECKTWLWYPDEVGSCHPGADYEWVPTSGTGSLYTLSTVRRAFLPDGAADAPYSIGLVELDDVPGARVVGNLAADEEWAIGDRLRADFVDHHGRRHPVFVHA